MQAYLRAHLRPLVHCLLRHDLAFMAHGENLIMVLRDGVPLRMLMKDIGEEVAVLGDQPLPESAERIRHELPPEQLPLPDPDRRLRRVPAPPGRDPRRGRPAGRGRVLGRRTRCIEEHAADHPELADAVERYDLLRPEFRHSCLNRLQLRNTLEMVDLAGPVESLVDAGQHREPGGRRRLSDQPVTVHGVLVELAARWMRSTAVSIRVRR